MTKTRLLELYDAQLRAEAEVHDAPELARIGPLLAATHPSRGRGFVTYQHIPSGSDLDALVAAVIDHYRDDHHVDQVEWKTPGHDALPHLEEVLLAHGFVLEDRETVMAGPVEAAIAAAGPLPAGHVVEVATDEAALREGEALAGRVFGDSPERSERRADALAARLQQDPDSFEMWLAREPGGTVVCSGRVDFVAGTQFAGLWGGACNPHHRGRGLYRAVTAARARSARARGHRYLQSDCTEFSGPILERAGLVPITTTTPAIWHRNAPADAVR